MTHRCLILTAVLVFATVNAAPSLAVKVLRHTSETSGQTVSAAHPATEPGPQETVKQFYAWYLQRLNKEDYDPLKNRTMALKYLTQTFLRRIPRLEKQMEADVIICSQEVNPAWEKNFTTELASIRGARATVLLALEGNVADTIKQKVTLERTRAGWRIAGVDCGQ